MTTKQEKARQGVSEMHERARRASSKFSACEDWVRGGWRGGGWAPSTCVQQGVAEEGEEEKGDRGSREQRKRIEPIGDVWVEEADQGQVEEGDHACSDELERVALGR